MKIIENTLLANIAGGNDEFELVESGFDPEPEFLAAAESFEFEIEPEDFEI
jgi:hypothetical protein